MTAAEHPTFTLAQLLKCFVLVSLLFVGLQGALGTYELESLCYWFLCCIAFGGLMGVKHRRIIESGVLGVIGFLLGLMLIGIGLFEL